MEHTRRINCGGKKIERQNHEEVRTTNYRPDIYKKGNGRKIESIKTIQFKISLKKDRFNSYTSS